MTEANTPTLDTSELVALCAKLPRVCDEASRDSAVTVATSRAQRMRSALPKRSGRLAASVTVDRTHDGATLSYGAGVPYANYIERGGFHGRPYVSGGRYVGPALNGADDEYARTTERETERGVNKL